VRVVIVGGGIVGLATAYQLSRTTRHRIVLIEKEQSLAAHQTGRNSGVIHSGIYYAPGSLKARTCLRGRTLMEEFCTAESLPWRRCGKLIVACDSGELERLAVLESRAHQHGLSVQSLAAGEWRHLEPHCTGLAALHVPETGVVDYSSVCLRLAERAQEAGVRILLGARLSEVHTRGAETVLRTERGEHFCDFWINCSGLYSDRFTSGPVRIVPFRGEYYSLVPEARSLCRTLIYPVPDPRFPFLGVHLTRHVDDSVGAGPNAVLSLGRENYTGWSPNWREAFDTLTYPGFLRLAARYWRQGAEEQLRSWSRRLFLRALQRLVPELRLSDLVPARAGIRAQAVHRNGTMVDDFVLEERPGALHVVNAPSPAATASLAIAEQLAARV
jgi:(S)-2-hydroxyglutarate dehydrogenase